MRKNMFRSKKGFTLIEAMVSLILIAVVAVAGFEFFRFCQGSVVDSKSHLVISNLSREAMEAAYFISNPESQDNHDNPEDISSLLPKGSGTRTVTVTPQGNYKIVEVTVTSN